jgi:hypothetical protein
MSPSSERVRKSCGCAVSVIWKHLLLESPCCHNVGVWLTAGSTLHIRKIENHSARWTDSEKVGRITRLWKATGAGWFVSLLKSQQLLESNVINPRQGNQMTWSEPMLLGWALTCHNPASSCHVP